MTERFVVGVLGKKGHGKDTLAQALVDHLGFERVAFADALKRAVAELYDVPVSLLEDREVKEKPLLDLDGKSPREVLQNFGMAKRREDPDYWVNIVRAQISGPGRYVLTDVRMPNEYDLVRSAGKQGRLVRVISDQVASEQDPTATHVSEIALDEHPVDLVLTNPWGHPEFMQVQGLQAVEEWLYQLEQAA